MMLDTMNDQVLTAHLLNIANDPVVREAVYQHLGEYCHQARNRLNSLKLCLYLAKRQTCEPSPSELNVLQDQYANLERAIDLIQMLCRPMPVSLASLGLDLLIEDRRPGWSRLAVELEIELECRPPNVRAIAKFDPDRMGEALDVLVRWRLSRLGAGSSAYMTWRVDRGRVHLKWQEQANCFTGSSDYDNPSHAWALPLITRVVDAHGGDVRIDLADGWRLDLEWPACPNGSELRAAL